MNGRSIQLPHDDSNTKSFLIHETVQRNIATTAATDSSLNSSPWQRTTIDEAKLVTHSLSSGSALRQNLHTLEISASNRLIIVTQLFLRLMTVNR